jgi:putative redox protein
MPRIAHVVAESEAGYAQTIRSGRHQLAADEPKAGGGTDTGPNPYGLLLASLGACTSITLRMYAQRKGWELGTIRVELDHERDGEVERIAREIRFSAPLSEEQRGKLLEVAEKTPVTKTIRRGTEIATTLHSGSV